MYVQGGEKLAGWNLEVSRRAPDQRGAALRESGELAAHVATSSAPAERGLTAAEPSPQRRRTFVKLGVVPHQLKFDKSELTVAPGQLVELVFANPDVMQHNFLLGAPGSLSRSGRRPTR